MDAEEERVGNGAAAAAVQGGNAWDFEEGESLFGTLCIACVVALFSADIKNQHITCHLLIYIYICFLTYLSHHLLSRSPFVVLPWRGRQRRFRAFHQ